MDATIWHQFVGVGPHDHLKECGVGNGLMFKSIVNDDNEYLRVLWGMI